MANNLPMIRKAFLATRNVSSSAFLLTERFERDSGGTLFYIIESASDKNGKNLQKYLQNDLVKTFMSSAGFSILDFESCLHFVNKKMFPIQEESFFTNTSSLIGFLENNTLHLCMTGEIEGYLLRKGKINSLTEGLDGDEEAGFHNITSGQLALGDLVIIGNKTIFNRLSLDRIRRTLNQFSPREAIKDFYQILRKTKDFGCNAIVLQAISSLADGKADEASPDFLYLDEIVESKLSRAYKVAVPAVNRGLHGLGHFARKTADQTKVLATNSSKSLKENISPKTRELLIKTNTRAIESFGKISTNVKSRRAIKVKPYSKLSPMGRPLWQESAIQIVQGIFAKKNRRYLYLALALILIFAAYTKIRANNQNREAVKRQNDATYSYDKAVETFNQAKEDIGLGRNDGVDKLSEAMSLAATAGVSNATKDKAAPLLRDIQYRLDEITKTKRIYDSKPIFSFKYDIVVSAVSGTMIYGISADGKIYTTDARDKSPKLIAAIPETLGKPIAATCSDSMSMMLVLTDTARLWGYDEQTQSGTEIEVDTGEAWEPANSIAAYSTSLYLLDSNAGKIWRHNKTGDKFGAGKAYAGTKNTDAKGGISLAIDGAIFVLKDHGVINKFSHSIPDTSFVLQSPPKPDDSVASAAGIHTDADSQYIFLLDTGKNRIIRYAKDGQYSSQYIIDQVGISQMLHNPRIQKLWVISGKDVYELDL